MNMPSRLTDLAIVVPCFNEERRIATLEDGTRRLLERAGAWRIELVIVDDGSDDGTWTRLVALRERALSWPSPPARVEILRQPRNLGKGAALARGVGATTARRVLTADADMATPLTQILDWQDAGRIDLAAGPDDTIHVASREHDLSVVLDDSRRRFLGRVYNLLVQMVTGLPIEDTQCGFKLYPGEAARAIFADLRLRGWGHDPEVLCRAVDSRLEVRTHPVRWRAQSGSKVRPFRDALVMAPAAVGARVLAWTDLVRGRGAAGAAGGRAWLHPTWERAAVVLWVALLAVIAATFDDYGVGWDEPLHVRYGELVHDYYTSLPSGYPMRGAIRFSNLYLYGGLFDWLAHLASRALPMAEVDTRHLVTALVGLLGIIGAWRLARQLGGSRAAFFAGIGLALTPTWYGHIFHNPKDVPFAVAYVWAVFYLVRAFSRDRTMPAGDVIKCGIAIACACAVRVGGVILLGYLALALAAYWLIQRLLARRPTTGLAARQADVALSVATITWLTLIATWPYAFENPITGPITALRSFSRFPFDDLTLFAGERVPTLDLPLRYLPTYLTVQLPIVVLLLAVTGGVLAVCGWRGRTGTPSAPATWAPGSSRSPCCSRRSTR